MSYKRLTILLLILSFILIFAGCLGNLFPLTPSVAPPEEKVGVFYLEPANLTITSSKDFTVELMNTSVTNLKAYSVTLSYDPELIRLNEVTEGSFFSSKGETFFYRDIDNQEGSVLIDCAILGRDLSVSGEGTLANLSFTCLKAGETGITFEFTDTRDTYNKTMVTTKRDAVIKNK